MANLRKVGSEYEEKVCEYLTGKGYEIVAQNYRAGRNEIDIICRIDKALVFVEVKSASTDEFGDAAYKVNISKQRAIAFAAQGYIQSSNVNYDSYRFDVVVVKIARGALSFDHIESAFMM